MPANPTMAATQRARVGRSPSTGRESTIANIGARKLMALASASGRKRSAPKKQSVATTRHSERASCIARWRVRQKPAPPRCHVIGVATIIWPA